LLVVILSTPARLSISRGLILVAGRVVGISRSGINGGRILKVDVHDLINIPGAGNAEKQLRKAGMWDDDLTTMLQNYLQDALSTLLNKSAHLASMKLKEAKE
jgi:hypothetical protein